MSANPTGFLGATLRQLQEGERMQTVKKQKQKRVTYRHHQAVGCQESTSRWRADIGCRIGLDDIKCRVQRRDGCIRWETFHPPFPECPPPPEEMKKSEGSENIELSDTEGLKSFAYYDSRTFHGTNPSGSALGVRQFLCQVPSWCQPFPLFQDPKSPIAILLSRSFFQSRYERQSRVSMHCMRPLNLSSRWPREIVSC